MKNWGNFTLLRIFDAGHMVPMDQPEVAHNMMMEFIKYGRLKSVQEKVFGVDSEGEQPENKTDDDNKEPDILFPED